jgi:hypothetical protein
MQTAFDWVLWGAEILVFAGALCEVLEIWRDIRTKPGGLIWPKISGPYSQDLPNIQEPEYATLDKKLAAVGWLILTIGLFIECLLTPFSNTERHLADGQSEDALRATQERLEKLESEVIELRSHVR